MEYRKALANFGFSLNLKYGETKDVDNTNNVDTFWNSLKNCLTATYGTNASVSADGNSVTVNFSDFQQSVFSKDSSAVKHSIKVPTYVSTDDSLYLKGLESRVVAPVVKESGISVYGLKGIPEFDTSVGYYNLAIDAFMYTAIALDIIGDVLGYSYFPLKVSDSISIDNLSYTYDADDLISVLNSYGLSDYAEKFSQNLSDNFGYILVKSVSISYSTGGWNDILADYNISSTLHFYDSGYVGEFISSSLVSPFAVSANDKFSVSLTIDLYDKDDNAVKQNFQIAIDYSPDVDLKLRGKSNEFHKIVFSFGKTKSNLPFDYGSILNKTSDTSPVYSVDKVLNGLSVGDYIVVFSDNFYAYRTVVSIDQNAKTIELDSDIPESPAYYSYSIPDSFVLSFPISENSSSYLSGYVGWRMSSYKLLYLSKNFFGQEKDATISSKDSYSLKISPFSSNIFEVLLVKDKLSLKDLIPESNSYFANLNVPIFIPLPKQPVADGELTTAYLEQLRFLKPDEYYNGYTAKIVGLGLPFVIIQGGDDFEDFVGYVDFIAVYSKDFADKYPSKAFLNENSLNEDKQAILLKKLVVGDDYSLYLSESLVESDKLFVVR